MTKTAKASLTVLIVLIAAWALVAISYLMPEIPKWVRDTASLLSIFSLLVYGLGKYFAWCWRYRSRWRRQSEADAAGEV